MATLTPTTDLTAPELAAWQGLLRVHAALAKALDAELEAAHGLALSSYEVLSALDDSAERRMRMCDLADRALLSRSGLTRLVDRLERSGLIARACCDADARGSFAVLTDAGRRTLDAARATHVATVRRRFLDHLEGAELEQLAGWFERVLRAGCLGQCGRAPLSAGP